MKTKIETDTVTAPAYWASALVNGDRSGLNEAEIELLETWLAGLDEGWSVVDVARDEDGDAKDARFTWSFRLYGGDAEGGDVLDYVIHKVVPVKDDPWMICPACRGNGHCVNPNIDDQGLTAEDFRDDPDFAEDYAKGVYNQRCIPCEGSGKIRESQLKQLEEAADRRRLAARENGDWDSYCGAGDYRHGF